jgi:hypothetical protein
MWVRNEPRPRESMLRAFPARKEKHDLTHIGSPPQVARCTVSLGICHTRSHKSRVDPLKNPCNITPRHAG